jgi:hypothetical protein
MTCTHGRDTVCYDCLVAVFPVPEKFRKAFAAHAADCGCDRCDTPDPDSGEQK